MAGGRGRGPSGTPVASGGLMTASAPIPTGTLVFTMAGESGSVTSATPVAFGGLMTSSGAGQTSNGLEDANIGGTLSSAQVPFTLNYITPVNGRSVLGLTGFAGGPSSL